mgnify:CR=1 FL=1
MFSRTKGTEAAKESEISGSGAMSPKQVTVIARGVKLEGNFVSEGDVHIEGDVEGHVKTSGNLMVGPVAVIAADVTAASATVAGMINGAVSVQKQLHIKATAKITGDIQCETIAVDAGAQLSGKLSVGGKS